MISYRIWKALHTPFVAHPLYWLSGIWASPYNVETVLKRLERQAQYIGIGITAISLFILAQFGLGTFMLFIVGLPTLIIAFGIPLGVLLSGSVYGFISAGVIALIISRERYQGRLGLLGVTPYGLAGAVWALGSMAIQKNSILSRLRVLLPPLYLIIGFLLVFPLSLLGIQTLSQPQNPAAHSAFNDVAASFILIIFSITDVVQSGNIGALIGMIVPVSTTSTNRAYITALILYISAQATVYLLAAFTWLIVWPFLGVAGGVMYYLTGLLTIVLYREIFIIALWWWLIRRLETDFAELDTITNISLRGKGKAQP